MTSVVAGGSVMTGESPLATLRKRALETTIPSMGSIMFSPTVAHAYENFLVAAGDSEGAHDGPPFMDGDLYKWLEAATFAVADTDDGELRAHLAKAATAIGRAQDEDGYLHTKTTIAQRAEPGRERFAERMDFETYNFGHLMTLACLHHRMTGDDSFLTSAIRVADFLIKVADITPELLADCNICPSHYMGTVELYRVTGDAKYLDLAGRLLDLHGGKGPEGGDDNQDVLPVREQREAVGHAVRANYLYAGMTDYALESGDPQMIEALRSIWADLDRSKIYVTGGCGALYDGASPDGGQNYWAVTRTHQAYGRPYQLPNTTAYNESCASLGLVMWAWRMLALTGESQYADAIERVLYNALPAMIGADATTYFYVNPLRQVRELPFPLRRPGDPKDAVPPASDQRMRQEYMRACFCCPPNVTRVIAELPYYVYAAGPTDLWVHQFVTGRATTVFDGVPVRVEQSTDFPASGDVTLTVSAEAPARGALRIRIPGWADEMRVDVDGVAVDRREKGYVVVDREWRGDTTVSVRIPLRTRLTVAHHFVEEVTNQVCAVRGPVVYCVESADLPEGVGVESVALRASTTFTEERGAGIFAGHVLLRATAARLPQQVPVGRLYGELDTTPPTDLDLTLVPYALWANRGPGEMSVWLQLLR
ncbi:glycoside hydrolase family 127 protein [Streptomyces sp. NPDC002795]|uniref:glycoside hydrolase family 127 protein n=1 Tax=Streptomyces sp. NPDC002795 TaxID=3364665 RepID=UPI0036C373F0